MTWSGVDTYCWMNHWSQKLAILIKVSFSDNLVVNSSISQVYRKVIQLYKYVYQFFFKFFSYLSYHRILSKVSCAVVGACCLCFKYSSVYYGILWWFSGKLFSVMQETWVQSMDWEDLLEKKIFHSNISWEIP